MEIIENYIPGDPELIDKIVIQLKSQGIFDEFRRECLSDVDTKPAYQNLRQRVDNSISTFLNGTQWSTNLNKKSLRENLRKHVYDCQYLDMGIERIVDQVVNPKICSVFLPKVEKVVYQFLGIKSEVQPEDTASIDPATLLSGIGIRRNDELKSSISDLKVESLNLLPEELEPISPDHDDEAFNSIHTMKEEKKEMEDLCVENVIKEEKLEVQNKIAQHSLMKDIEKRMEGVNGADIEDDDDDTSPVFEPIFPMKNEDDSVDSDLSGFSGLTSLGSPKQHRNELSDFNESSRNDSTNDKFHKNSDLSNRDQSPKKCFHIEPSIDASAISPLTSSSHEASEIIFEKTPSNDKLVEDNAASIESIKISHSKLMTADDEKTADSDKYLCRIASISPLKSTISEDRSDVEIKNSRTYHNGLIENELNSIHGFDLPKNDSFRVEGYPVNKDECSKIEEKNLNESYQNERNKVKSENKDEADDLKMKESECGILLKYNDESNEELSLPKTPTIHYENSNGSVEFETVGELKESLKKNEMKPGSLPPEENSVTSFEDCLSKMKNLKDYIGQTEDSNLSTTVDNATCNLMKDPSDPSDRKTIMKEESLKLYESNSKEKEKKHSHRSHRNHSHHSHHSRNHSHSSKDQKFGKRSQEKSSKSSSKDNKDLSLKDSKDQSIKNSKDYFSKNCKDNKDGLAKDNKDNPSKDVKDNSSKDSKDNLSKDNKNHSLRDSKDNLSKGGKDFSSKDSKDHSSKIVKDKLKDSKLVYSSRKESKDKDSIKHVSKSHRSKESLSKESLSKESSSKESSSKESSLKESSSKESLSKESIYQTSSNSKSSSSNHHRSFKESHHHTEKHKSSKDSSKKRDNSSHDSTREKDENEKKLSEETLKKHSDKHKDSKKFDKMAKDRKKREHCSSTTIDRGSRRSSDRDNDGNSSSFLQHLKASHQNSSNEPSSIDQPSKKSKNSNHKQPSNSTKTMDVNYSSPNNIVNDASTNMKSSVTENLSIFEESNEDKFTFRSKTPLGNELKQGEEPTLDSIADENKYLYENEALVKIEENQNESVFAQSDPILYLSSSSFEKTALNHSAEQISKTNLPTLNSSETFSASDLRTPPIIFDKTPKIILKRCSTETSKQINVNNLGVNDKTPDVLSNPVISKFCMLKKPKSGGNIFEVNKEVVEFDQFERTFDKNSIDKLHSKRDNSLWALYKHTSVVSEEINSSNITVSPESIGESRKLEKCYSSFSSDSTTSFSVKNENEMNDSDDSNSNVTLDTECWSKIFPSENSTPESKVNQVLKKPKIAANIFKVRAKMKERKLFKMNELKRRNEKDFRSSADVEPKKTKKSFLTDLSSITRISSVENISALSLSTPGLAESMGRTKTTNIKEEKDCAESSHHIGPSFDNNLISMENIEQNKSKVLGKESALDSYDVMTKMVDLNDSNQNLNNFRNLTNENVESSRKKLWEESRSFLLSKFKKFDWDQVSYMEENNTVIKFLNEQFLKFVSFFEDKLSNEMKTSKISFVSDFLNFDATLDDCLKTDYNIEVKRKSFILVPEVNSKDYTFDKITGCYTFNSHEPCEMFPSNESKMKRKTCNLENDENFNSKLKKKKTKIYDINKKESQVSENAVFISPSCTSDSLSLKDKYLSENESFSTSKASSLSVSDTIKSGNRSSIDTLEESFSHHFDSQLLNDSMSSPKHDVDYSMDESGVLNTPNKILSSQLIEPALESLLAESGLCSLQLNGNNVGDKFAINLTGNSLFSLPLTPESDSVLSHVIPQKSNKEHSVGANTSTTKKKATFVKGKNIPPIKQRNALVESSIGKLQRYDSSDLYKPRPLFSQTSRRARSNNSNNRNLIGVENESDNALNSNLMVKKR